MRSDIAKQRDGADGRSEPLCIRENSKLHVFCRALVCNPQVALRGHVAPPNHSVVDGADHCEHVDDLVPHGASADEFGERGDFERARDLFQWWRDGG